MTRIITPRQQGGEVVILHDSKAAENVISMLRDRFERPIKFIADGEYRGDLIENTKRKFRFLT